jgi:hypothetical protein
MGKKAKKLALALHKENEALVKKYNPDIVIEDDKVKVEVSYNELLRDLTMQIEKDILDYSHDNALPLCEYLDYNNSENFVKWLLSRQK